MRGRQPTRAALIGMGLALATLVAPWSRGDLASAQEADGGYRLVEDWPRYPPGATFEMGTGIAVDARGVVYAISRDVDHWASHPLAMTRYRGQGSIWIFDRGGAFLGKFAEDQAFIGPHSIYVDGDGFVWVVDRDGHQVKKLTRDGTLVLTLGEYGKFGDDDSHFNGAHRRRDSARRQFRHLRRLLELAAGLVRQGRDLSQGSRRVRQWARPAWRRPCRRGRRARPTPGRQRLRGCALHPYVTVPGQIAEERLRPIPGCRSRFDVFGQDGSYEGPWSVVEGALTLSIAAYGDRIYAGTTGAERGRQDVVIVGRGNRPRDRAHRKCGRLRAPDGARPVDR